MAFELETIAKELTLVALPKVMASGDPRPEPVGKYYGLLYKTILKEVREAYNAK